MWLDELKQALARGQERIEPWPALESTGVEGRLRAALEEAIGAEVERRAEQARASKVELEAKLSAKGELDAFERMRLDAAAAFDGPKVRSELRREWLAGRATHHDWLRRLHMHALDAGFGAKAALDVLVEACRSSFSGESETENELDLEWHAVQPFLKKDAGHIERDVLMYAHECRLMVAGRTTPTGRVLVSLVGRRAVLWLLTNELLQSTGPLDPWRLSRETLETLVERPSQVVEDLADQTPDYDPVNWFPHAWETISRLARLGILQTDHLRSEMTGYRVFADGLEILEALRSPSAPMRAAIGGLLEQDLAHQLQASGGVPMAVDTAAEWVVETMAHGLRNALVPVEHALEGLAATATSAQSSRLDRSRRGVTRALRLVGELVDLYQSSRAPPERFALSEALADAASVANGGGVDLRVDGLESVRLEGRRPRFVHALADTIRNARQHGGKPDVLVRLSAEVSERHVTVHVDDDGRGIPEEVRARVFERGFSTRPDGTGQGLALLRDVIEREMGGEIQVSEAPDLGGARFSLVLPSNEVE